MVMAVLATVEAEILSLTPSTDNTKAVQFSFSGSAMVPSSEDAELGSLALSGKELLSKPAQGAGRHGKLQLVNMENWNWN